MTRMDLRPLPHREAIEYFNSKGFAPFLQRFHHLDLFREEHARNWVVAKAMRDDVSRAIRDEMTRALAEGRTLTQFQQTLAPRLQELGWWGRQAMQDPLTGETTEAQLGSMRRLRTIFDTNMRTAHAAGHWASIQRTARAFPYLEYIQIDRPTKRHDHTRFHGKIWRVDDPIWLRIYPPNGYFCGCHVIQRTEGWMKRNKRSVDPAPDLEEQPWTNKRTGQVLEVPRGVHPGFDTNPGAAWLDTRAAWARVAPEMEPARQAEARGLIEGLRLRRLNSAVESLVVTDAALNPVAMTSGTAEAPDVRIPDGPLPFGGSIFRASLTEAPPAPAEVTTLFAGSLDASASVTTGGAIWRMQRGPTEPQGPLEAFNRHVGENVWAQAMQTDELSIVFRHAMLLWLERAGVITYRFHLSQRLRQILDAHADLLVRLAP